MDDESKHPDAGTTGLRPSHYVFSEWARENVYAARDRAKLTEGQHAERMALGLFQYRGALSGSTAVRAELVELFATSLGYPSFAAMVAAMDELHGPKVFPLHPVKP